MPEKHGFHYVKVEFLPSFIHSYHCLFKGEIETARLSVDNIKKRIQNVFDVYNVDTFIKDGKICFDITCNSFEKDLNKDIEKTYLFELERRYCGAYAKKKFDYFHFDLSLEKSIPWDSIYSLHPLDKPTVDGDE